MDKFPPATLNIDTTKRALLRWSVGLFLILASAAIFFLNTNHGIGILPDTTRYMRLGPQSYDAPMYTWFLDGFVLSGIDIVTGAKILGFLLTIINSALVWQILIRGTDSNLYAAVGTALIVFSPHFVGGHAVAMSEPLFIFFVFCSLFALLKIFESGNWIWVAAGGIVVALTALVRFSGVSLGPAFVVCLLVNPARRVGQRVLDVVIFSAVSSIVFFAWAIVSKLTTGQATGRALALYGNADAKRWLAGLETLSALLIPVQVPLPLRLAVLLFVIAGSAWLCIRYIGSILGRAAARKWGGNEIVPVYLALFSLFYIVFMIAALNIEANLPLNGRYALPFYVTTVMTMTIVFAHTRPVTGIQKIFFYVFAAFTFVLLASHAARTVDRTREAYAQGIGYASVAWSVSPVIQAIKKLPDNATIYSNGPDVINYLTKRATLFIPFRIKRRTGIEDPANPLDRQLEDMGQRLAMGNGYVVFLNEIDWRFFLITEAELKQKLELVMIDERSDGRIYNVSGSLLKN